MESQQPAGRVRAILLGLVVLWGALPLPAAPLKAQLNLETDRFVVGTKFTLDIVVNTADPQAVRFSYGALPAALGLVEGPNIREASTWEESLGKMSRSTHITLTLKVLAPAILELGPWTVKVGNKDLSVAPFTVYLLASDEAKLRFPIDARWVVPPGPYYQGQAIPLLLQVRNLDTLSQPGEMTLPAPNGALLDKVTGLGEIEISSAGEDRIMNIPWGGWMLIPTKEGTVTVPAVKVSVLGLTRTTQPISLEVLALPEGAQVSRAVGNLTYSIDAHEGTDDQSGQFIVTQEVKGEGNFPALVLPPVTAGSLTLLSKQENVHTKATSIGYSGNLVVTWRFQTERAGSLGLRLPGFQSFQPSTGLVNTWEDRFISVNLSAPPAEKPVAATRPLPLTWEQVLAARPWGLWGSWWGFALAFPGLLFWLATYWKPRSPGPSLFVVLPLVLLLSAASNLGPPENFAKARTLQDWSALTVAHPNEPGFWYNKALAAADSQKTALAIHALRRALDLGYQGTEAASVLRTLEEDQVLVDQFHPWLGLSSDLLFAMILVSLNLGFLFWGGYRLSRRPFWLVLASLSLMGCVTATSALVVEESVRHEANAVVGPSDGPLKKVPGSLAERWMSLRGGTVVKILGRTLDDVLVQTGYGLEGWVSANDLLLLDAIP
ncbi:MAG: hypothetical protein WCG80_15365 [Spirochaetales bacterium]